MTTAIPVEDGTIDAYLARPLESVSGDPPWPGVVIVHDIIGISEDTKAIADRFATEGYLAITPNLYARGTMLRCVKSIFQQSRAGRGRAFDDIDATRRLLAGREDCTGKVGVVGFCTGGGFALVAATRGFDVAAPYYGELPKNSDILRESCPIVASYAGRDKNPALRHAAGKLAEILREFDIPHDIQEYPNAGHGFANRWPFGPFNVLLKVVGVGYDHQASEDAWQRVMAFFAEHLR